MITLYGHPFSRAHRVMWVLKELGLTFEHVPTGFQDGTNKLPEFLEINPNGRVPALVDDGLALFESLAINLHLARKYGGEIGPSTIAEEALMTQWSFWVATEIEKPLLFTAANLMLFPEADRRESELTIGYTRLDRPFRVLDSALSERRWLVGGRFTIADLNVSAVMTLLPICGVPIDRYPAMAEWLDRCLERPAAADWKPIRFSVPRPPTDAGMLAMFL